MRVNALITPLGTLGVFQGAAILIAGPGVANLPPGFTALGRAESLTLQSPVWLMLGLALLAHYLLGERIGYQTLLGGAIIMAGVFVTSWGRVG
jgi:ribose/xylose/arabinose/galactoside ABC-type transport system permease subunit